MWNENISLRQQADEDENMLFQLAEQWKKSQEEEKLLAERANTEEKEEKPEEKVEVTIVNAEAASVKDISSELKKGVPGLKFVLTEKVEEEFEKQQKAAKRALINAISDCAYDMQPSKIDGITFLSQYVKTQEVLATQSDNKKVQYICNLFVKYFVLENHREDVGLFEEFLNALVTLSGRQIELLTLLHKFEKNSELYMADPYTNLKMEIQKTWGLADGQLEGIMAGISKTGFCVEVSSDFFSCAGNAYRTTEYFDLFMNYITKA
jgi:hypothetical protein